MASDWQERFRAPTIYSIDVAPAAPHRGLIVSDHGGAAAQVHAWEVPSGTLRPLTDSPTGVFEAWISPDGEAVYWHADQQGDEFGHLVRQPFVGGVVEDTTPGLGSYTLRGVGFSAAGKPPRAEPCRRGRFPPVLRRPWTRAGSAASSGGCTTAGGRPGWRCSRLTAAWRR